MVNNSNLREHTSNFGIIIKDLKSMLACTIGFFIIIYSFYLLFHKTLRTSNITAVITDVNCSKVIHLSSLTWNCYFKAKYQIGDKTYTNNFRTTGTDTIKNINDTITLYYDPNNVNNIDISVDNPRKFGFIMLAIGIIIPIIGITLSYFSNKDKFTNQNLYININDR